MSSSQRKPPDNAPRLAGQTPFSSKKREEAFTDTGRVTFDDRGNAIWQWSVSTGAYGTDVSQQKIDRLVDGKLSIDDPAPPKSALAVLNTQGLKKGYNPYESVRAAKAAEKGPPKKKDLRKLGEWLKQQKQAKKNKSSED